MEGQPLGPLLGWRSSWNGEDLRMDLSLMARAKDVGLAGEIAVGFADTVCLVALAANHAGMDIRRGAIVR